MRMPSTGARCQLQLADVVHQHQTPEEGALKYFQLSVGTSMMTWFMVRILETLLFIRTKARRRIIMVVDWIGFCYAGVLAFGGVLGYTRKGSLVSLGAGLFFGFLAAYGAYCITYNSRDVKPSFYVAFIMATMMGVRYRRSRKVMPAGLVAGLSLIMLLRLGILLLL